MSAFGPSSIPNLIRSSSRPRVPLAALALASLRWALPPPRCS